MSVPNTETFSLTDITAELGGGETSLQQCFTNADEGYDPSYNDDGYATANSQLRFRNYRSILGDIRLISVTDIVRINESTYSGTALIGLFERGTSTPLNFSEVFFMQLSTSNLDGLGNPGGYAKASTIGSPTVTMGVYYTGADSGEFSMDLSMVEFESGYSYDGSPTITKTVPAWV